MFVPQWDILWRCLPPEMFVRRLILWRCLSPEMFVRRLINNKTFYEDVYPLKCSYEGLSTIWHFMKMFTPWNVRTKAYQQYPLKCSYILFYEDVYPLKCSYEGLSTIRHFMFYPLKCSYEGLSTIWHFMKCSYECLRHLWRCLPPEMFVRRLINNMTFYEDVYPLKCSYEGLSTIWHFMKTFYEDILWNVYPLKCSYEGLSTIWHFMKMFTPEMKCSYEGLSTIWHFMKMFTPWNVRTKAYQQYDILWRCLPPEMFVRRLINNKTFYEDVYPLKCSYEGCLIVDKPSYEHFRGLTSS